MRRSVQIGSFIVFALAGAACGIDSSLVGGTCKSGYVEYGDSCVVAPRTTGPAIGSPDGATPVPTGTSTTPTPSATSPDADPPVPTPNDGGSDADPATTPDASPDASADASPDASADASPDASADASVDPPLVCVAPLTACQGACISVESDAHNCGACGRVCASNICAAGACVGATPGDVVLIGHDMTNARTSSSQAKVLTNAISIPTTNPIRVLSYEAGAASAAWSQTRAIVTQSISRQVQFTIASPEDLESTTIYSSYDVVLVHGASGADPATLGARWATALQTFTKKGGVFVAIDAGDSDVPALVSATGLLSIPSHTALPSTTQFVVAAPGNVVGAQVLSPYAAFGASVAFVGVAPPSADLTWVVRTDDGASLPTVLHTIVR